MKIKRVLCPQRLRKIPNQFSWLDQRLVRDRWIEQCHASAWALYLFLTTVGDCQGLSYYSDESIRRRLSMDGGVFMEARKELLIRDLIAYEKPLYQVLSLESLQNSMSSTMDRQRIYPSSSKSESILDFAPIGQVVQNMMGGLL